MAFPLSLLAGLGLAGALAFSSRKSSGPSASSSATTCAEARALAVEAIGDFVRATTLFAQESAASRVLRAKEDVSRICPESALAVQPPSCRAAASELTAYLATRAGSERDEDEEAKLFEKLFSECPYLTSNSSYFVRLQLPGGAVESALIRDTPEATQPYLDRLTEANVAYLASHPDTPALYASGVRYAIESMGIDDWKSVPYVIESGYGDCEDLACWLAAEYRLKGIAARPFATSASIGSLDVNLLHIQVLMPDGSVEDPSARLGMTTLLGGE